MSENDKMEKILSDSIINLNLTNNYKFYNTVSINNLLYIVGTNLDNNNKQKPFVLKLKDNTIDTTFGTNVKTCRESHSIRGVYLNGGFNRLNSQLAEIGELTISEATKID